MKSTYELTIILGADVNEEGKEKTISNIKKVISPSGKITKTEIWGKRALAYPIKKAKEGVYIILTLETSAELTKTLAGKLRLNEELLRYLLIRRK